MPDLSMKKNFYISKFHYITQDLKDVTHQELIQVACENKVDWIQLRVKNKSSDEFLKIAEKSLAICRKSGVRLIINDNTEITAEINADGVHLGKTDMKPSEARKVLGPDFIVGGTANTFEDILFLESERVDYIGLGPFRFTETKENLSPVLGINGFAEIIGKCKEKNINIPVIAIGGIQAEDVRALLETGIYGIAVSSAVNLSDNPVNSLQTFINLIKNSTCTV